MVSKSDDECLCTFDEPSICIVAFHRRLYRNGTTLLMHAVLSHHDSMVRLLAEHGADVNATNE